MRLHALAAAALFTLLTLPAPAAACSCVVGIPICDSFWKTPLVFSGEAVDIVPLEGGRGAAFARRSVRFKVERVWRGEAGETVSITTGAGGGDCGFRFRIGERYLVYATEYEGALWTGVCSRTRRLSQAAEDLAYIERVRHSPDGGRVFGTVFRARPDGSQRRPAGGYDVTLRGAGTERAATTDADGRYEFTGVPAGRYTLHVEERPGERTPDVRVELPDARGCALADAFVTVERTGRTGPVR